MHGYLGMFQFLQKGNRMTNYEKAQKSTIERVEHMGVRGYRLTNGDVFTVDSRRLFDVFTMNNSCYFFCPMRKYKKKYLV